MLADGNRARLPFFIWGNIHIPEFGLTIFIIVIAKIKLIFGYNNRKH